MKIALLGVAVLFFVTCFLLARIIREDTVADKPEEPSFPALLEDAAFRADLGAAGPSGLKGVLIVAPASGLRPEKTNRAYELAERLGVTLPAAALDPEATPYNAASDAVRLDLLVEALTEDAAEVVWAFRGGYGAGRLLPKLDKLAKPPAVKPVVGYSDITFLHLFLQRWNWPTIHGAMFWDLMQPDKDEDNFRLLAGLLSGRLEELRYDGIKPLNQAAMDLEKPLEAALTGGNLTCLAAAIGTPWRPDAAGKILFLEDVGEKGFRLDRLTTQLEEAGVLADATAVLLGTFTNGDEHVRYAIERFAAACAKPVFQSDRFGHGPKNHPLVFNVPAVLAPSGKAGGDFTLTIPVDAGWFGKTKKGEEETRPNVAP